MLLTIVILSFFLGCAAGFIMHRSDFCMAGMFRDLFLFRSLAMLRVLLLLIVASMVLFELARLFGLVRLPFPLFAPPSLVTPIGGALFGVGMVLAGGCAIGTLYKMGAGSLPSLLAFVGLLAGSAFYAEFHPWWMQLSRATRLASQVSLPQMLGVSPTLAVALFVVAAGCVLFRWFRAGKLDQPAFAEGYLQPWRAALWLALLGLGSALLVGMPFGITTAYAKMGGYLESLAIPGHVASLAYFIDEPFRFTHPFLGFSLQGGAGPRLDGIVVVQFPVVFGILCGSAFSAARLKEWKFSAKVPLKQCFWALFGGMLMGLGARLVPGCNVWHLMGGAPMLAGQSLLFIAALFPGAWLGSRILVKYVV
ncbi:YeeE/YedE family protein [Trichloromonas sp.]|uniref:YeeE/YedE family protein n=1 Tax=Trichloromonas sp. TaxID=3069249 RepID=UPI003D8160C8